MVIRDVTVERQIERHIHQQERLAVVGQLAAGVAHYFNNLLTAINGFTELMKLQITPTDPLQELVKSILNSGNRAAKLVSQLLVFSRRF